MTDILLGLMCCGVWFMAVCAAFVASMMWIVFKAAQQADQQLTEEKDHAA